jgi:hypothetical protein
MPRPLSRDVVEEIRHCPVHGMVVKRRHKHVVKNGKQQYLWRCLTCHNEKTQNYMRGAA